MRLKIFSCKYGDTLRRGWRHARPHEEAVPVRGRPLALQEAGEVQQLRRGGPGDGAAVPGLQAQPQVSWIFLSWSMILSVIFSWKNGNNG